VGAARNSSAAIRVDIYSRTRTRLCLLDKAGHYRNTAVSFSFPIYASYSDMEFQRAMSPVGTANLFVFDEVDLRTIS
jgi:hypothetical protein